MAGSVCGGITSRSQRPTVWESSNSLWGSCSALNQPTLTTCPSTGTFQNPSVASFYRALAEAEEAAIDDGLPLRPKPVHIRRPEDPLTPEEIDLRERLQAQPHPNAEMP
jgi:hypothetical protein